MKISYVAASVALSALLTIPARGATMTPDARQDVTALGVVEIACRGLQPGKPITLRPATAAQSQALHGPSGMGATAAAFNCTHNYIGELNSARRGAALHDALSQWILGELYSTGLPAAGIGADPAESFAYLMQSARQGFPQGLLAAGVALIEGQGTAANPKLGAALVLRAAMQGVPAALRVMGELYLHGIGVPFDPRRAEVWLKDAAAEGDPQARRWIAEHQHSSAAAGARSSAASAAPQPRAQADSTSASAPAGRAPVDHQQELEELQRFWTLYFKASHARVVDFGAPALVQPVGFAGPP